MAYTEVNKTERENYLYTFRRASLLSEIFYDNYRLANDVYPFDGVYDTFDVLLSEQYTLYDGGDAGVAHAVDMIGQLNDMKEEFLEDSEVIDLIDTLIDEYTEYKECYAKKGV